MTRPPRILTIAGSDSSGGAGIQADIKTITMLGGYAMSAITSVTAQNSVGVQDIAPLTGSIVATQIASCIEDIGIDAIKIGMLHDADVISHVAEALQGVEAPIVIDPVMISTSGAALIDPDAIAVLRKKLFPLASLITPNLPELAHLLNCDLTQSAQLPKAAETLANQTGTAVLAKGGHIAEERVIDLLYEPDGKTTQFEHVRMEAQHTHGTGCTLSSAIATLLGHGQSLEHAVRLARQFVLQAIEHAPGFGSGSGPLGHQAVRDL